MELPVKVIVTLLMPFHVLVVLLLACAVRELLRPEQPAVLRNLEWLFPLRGRWLRYLAAVVPGALFLFAAMLLPIWPLLWFSPR